MMLCTGGLLSKQQAPPGSRVAVCLPTSTDSWNRVALHGSLQPSSGADGAEGHG